ncbi:hypothetical protein [Methylibium petroleiphilum]|nr:hypothetical protein [Methylibium petroleiphilum]
MSRLYRAAGVLAVLALHALGAHLDAVDSAAVPSRAGGHRMPGVALNR